MSVPNSPANLKYQTAWERALGFLDRLSQKQQKYYDLLRPGEKQLLRDGASPDDILKLLQKTGEKKHSRFTKFSDKVLKPFSQFQGVIEATASACSGIGGPVVSSTAGEFGKIDGFLRDILEKLKMFKAVEEHFRPSPTQTWDHLYDVLANFYVDIIDFTLVTAKHYRTNAFKYFIRRFVTTFDGDFGNVIENMQRHLDSISPAVQLAGIKQGQQNYEALSSLVKSDTNINSKFQSEERKIAAREWLSGTGSNADLQKHTNQQLVGTCQWFFKHQKYHDWFVAKYSSRLCVLGIPGSGKSVLSSALVSHLKADLLPEQSVLYFFCKNKDHDRDNPSSILRTLMLQLLSHPTHGPRFVGLVHGARSSGVASRQWSVQDLWTLMQTMLSQLSLVYMVIDGLDECREKEELLDILRRIELFSTGPSGAIIKVFTSCRPNEFQINWPSIETEQSSIQGDINSYIISRIERSATLRLPANKTRIHTAIREGAGGTFLWASLMLDTLQASSAWQIEKVLQDIPRDLSDVYELMLERVSNLGGRSVERCRKILHWCIVAHRLLTVNELLLALAVSEGVTSHEQYNSGSDQADSLRLLRHDCGSLINILNDDTVQLIHTSLQEYLLRAEVHPGTRKLIPTPGMLLTDLDQAHIELAKVCISYNQFACFQEEYDGWSVEKFETEFPLVRYAICYWVYHVFNSGNSESALSNDVLAFLDSTQGWMWLWRCPDFDITNYHRDTFQEELTAWIMRAGEGHASQSRFAPIRSFVLHLWQCRYDDPDREQRDQGDNVGRATHELGMVHHREGRYDMALEFLNLALAEKEKTIGCEHWSVQCTLTWIAISHCCLHRIEEAQVYFRRALDGFLTGLGKGDTSGTVMLDNIALTYRVSGRYDKAIECHERTVAAQEKTLGSGHVETLGTINDKAVILLYLGWYQEDWEFFRRALSRREKVLGIEHPVTLATLQFMGGLYDLLEMHDHALVLYRAALETKEKTFGKEHLSTLETVNKMAIVDCHRRQWDQAIEQFTQVFDGRKRVLGEQHDLTLQTAESLQICRNELEKQNS